MAQPPTIKSDKEFWLFGYGFARPSPLLIGFHSDSTPEALSGNPLRIMVGPILFESQHIRSFTPGSTPPIALEGIIIDDLFLTTLYSFAYLLTKPLHKD